MRRSSRAAVVLTLSLLGGVAVAQTSIVGPVLLPTGGNANGFVEISWPSFQSGANYIGASKFTRTITAGVLQTTALYPTDTAVPSFSYTVRYTLGGVQSGPYSWAVPTSGSPVTIQSIQSAGPPVSPGVTFPYNSLTGAPWVTNATWKADVQASGSAGTVRIYDQTAVTGATKFDVRAGAGQSTTNMQRWVNNAGVQSGGIGSDGSYSAFNTSTSDRKSSVYASGIALASDTGVGWKSAASLDSGSLDLGLCRSAAKFIEINNGTCGQVYGSKLFVAKQDVQDATPSTGVTFVRLLGGAGQSGNNILEIFPAADGDSIIDVGADGSLRLGDDSDNTAKVVLYGDAMNPTVGLSSDTLIKFRSTTNWDTGSVDTGLARNVAGVVEFNNGTAGAAGYGQAVSFILNPLAVSRPTCNSGNRGKLWQTYGGAGVTDTVAVCAKDSGDSYSWRTIF